MHQISCMSLLSQIPRSLIGPWPRSVGTPVQMGKSVDLDQLMLTPGIPPNWTTSLNTGCRFSSSLHMYRVISFAYIEIISPLSVNPSPLDVWCWRILAASSSMATANVIGASWPDATGYGETGPRLDRWLSALQLDRCTASGLVGYILSWCLFWEGQRTDMAILINRKPLWRPGGLQEQVDEGPGDVM